MEEHKQTYAESVKGKNGVKRIINACHYSIDGLGAAYRNEAAFRQLTWLNIISLPIIFFCPFALNIKMILVSATFLTLIVELFNTAIEAIVDRISLEKHPLSKIAKDAGSAAQTMALLILAILWGMALWDYWV